MTSPWRKLALLAGLLDDDGNPPGGPPSGAAGGELAGTYPNPTVATTHSGSSHAGLITTHEAASDPHPGYLTPTEGDAAYDALGAAAAAQAASQPLDSDLTAIAAVATTALGRGLLASLSIVPYRLQSFVSGCLAENMPKAMVNANTGLLSTGRLSSTPVTVPANTPCTNGSFVSATTAINTATNWWFAIVDSAFNVIRQTTDQLATAWGANTLITLALDSIPVTAGARVASSTVTLTFPTLSESLTSLIAPGDSVVVSNANIAAYNGTFSVVTVSSTQITYVSGGSATDSLAAPFPTVRLAAGKRVYTPSADALLYGVVMVKANTVPTLAGFSHLSGVTAVGPAPTSGNTGQTGTCPSPITHGTGSGGANIWFGIS